MASRALLQTVKASRTARWCLGAYLLVAIYASLHPFTGWRDPEIAPWAFLFDPWPRYLTRFDVLVNLAAYLPLGLLAAFSLPPRWPRWLAWLLATLGGVALSALMEGLQTYLPLRVAALSDFLANSGGAAIGALLGVLLARPVLGSQRLREPLAKWLVPHAAPLLALLMLWAVAQLHPSSTPFVTGRFAPLLLSILASVRGDTVNTAVFDPSQPLSADQFVLLESVLGALALTALACVARCGMRETAPRVLMMAGVLVFAVATKTLAGALQYGPQDALGWFTDGAQGALLIASVAAALVALMPRVAAVATGAALLTLQLALANAMIENPYFAATFTRWQQGRFINFFGLTQWASALWPFVALLVLLLIGNKRPKAAP
jgi:VanZ family protein